MVGREQIMSLDRLFDTIDGARQAAQWKAAFGEPIVVEGKTIIPVAQVSYGFGLGFGHGEPQARDEDESSASEEGGGGGGGGGTSAKPLGAIVVSAERVHFEGALDISRLGIAGLFLAALVIVQLAKTLRAIFGQT
jgi:uncharacterized spore protein YtfJ